MRFEAHGSRSDALLDELKQTIYGVN
jgi:hypothetical protein